MTIFNVEYSAESLSQLKILNKIIIKRIIKKVESTRVDPYQFFKRLTGRPEYKLRVGDYRIIANIEQDKKIVFVRSIGHRKDVYKKL